MLQLLAENPLLKQLLLFVLFAIVTTLVYLATQAVTVRQIARRRLLESAPIVSGAPTLGSLRTERIESAWLKLVNTIEKRGISLIDTKDVTLRQKLIAAGYPQAFAPR